LTLAEATYIVCNKAYYLIYATKQRSSGMPAMVLRYEIPEGMVDELAHILVTVGGRGGIQRASQLLGCSKETLLRGLMRRSFGPRVGQRIIDGMKKTHPNLEGTFLVFKCK
jgi:hypothetical protein